jgi:putative DNA primase/helicase
MADSGIERGAAALDKIITEGGKKKPRKKHLHAVPASGETFDAGGRRVIRHDPGRLPEVLDQLGAALAVHTGNLYVYAGRLVRVYAVPEAQSGRVHRPRGALILHPIDAAHLVELAGRAALHERFDARADRYKPCDCPKRVAEAYLARGYWPEIPTLAGFIEAPTITLDGRLIDQHGFDADSNLFLAFDKIAGYVPPPPAPSFEDAEQSMSILLDLIHEFPLVDYEDRAAVLAGIIGGLVRRILPAAPMMAITAPTPGTGKTLVAETFSIVASNRRASVLSLGHDDAEAEKRLSGVLLAGDACILLDNIERPLKGDLLCQVLTQPSVRLRPLGASGMISIPTHALMVATGNNLAVVGDLKRRVAMIRLDAGTERPEQRTFNRDHLADVFARRGELIRAALTITLAYLAAGAPAIEGLHPLGGFAEWDRMVRRPLVWLGLPDPLKASEGLREQDPDLEAMRLLFSAWRETFGDKPATVAEVVAAGMATPLMSSDRTHPELYDALQLVCSEKPNARRLGYWLRAHRDRIVDGLQLKSSRPDGHAKVARWQVVSCG